MSRKIRIENKNDYNKAGPTDLIRMLEAPQCNAQYVPRGIIDTFIFAVTDNQRIHLSGGSGTGKSSFLEAFLLCPENFQFACQALGFDPRPLVVHPIHMPTFESASEVFSRRALSNGTIYDEPSSVCRALIAADEDSESYHLIWLRELGRVHSSSVQCGLLDLISKTTVILPDGRHIDGTSLSIAADSNYQAQGNDASIYNLVDLDSALARRLSVNIHFDYLPPEQEVQVLENLLAEEGQEVDRELVANVVKLGQAIRDHQSEGTLHSVSPPSISGFLTFLRMSLRLPHFSPQQVARVTLLGNASDEDANYVDAVLGGVFALQTESEEATLAEGVF